MTHAIAVSIPVAAQTTVAATPADVPKTVITVLVIAPMIATTPEALTTTRVKSPENAAIHLHLNVFDVLAPVTATAEARIFAKTGSTTTVTNFSRIWKIGVFNWLRNKSGVLDND